MAPRGRNKKAGLQRIDAAFDALIPLGFSREVIQKTIKSLLKAYGGDEGWVFIEEASYKLLIETILEQQEEEEHKHALEPVGDNLSDSRALEINEQVVDAGDISLPPAGGQHSAAGDLAPPSGDVDECEDGVPVPAGCASPSSLPVGNGDDLCQHASSGVAGVVAPSSPPQIDQLPTRNRPACHGWISESESESESDLEGSNHNSCSR